jgi:hypothetical protein
VRRVFLEVTLGELAERRRLHGGERQPTDPLSLLIESGDRHGFLPIVRLAGEPDPLPADAAQLLIHA